MSNLARIIYETTIVAETTRKTSERRAAALAVASWCHRHNEPAETLYELLDALGLVS